MNTIYAILEPRHIAAGMYVEEDEDFVFLFNKDGGRIAKFGSHMNIGELHAIADEELMK